MESPTPQRSFTVARKPVPDQLSTTETHNSQAEEKDLYITEKPVAYSNLATLSYESTPTPQTLTLRQKWTTAATKLLDKLPVSRRVFFISIMAALALVLALSIGLGLGLPQDQTCNYNAAPPDASTTAQNGEVKTGEITFFDPALGACGVHSGGTESIVAVSHIIWDAVQVGGNPNTNPLCGLRLEATVVHPTTGAANTVDLTVVDRCENCTATDIDTTRGVFYQLAPESAGRVPVTWTWLDPVPAGV